MRAQKTTLIVGSFLAACLSTERIIRRNEGAEVVGANEAPIESLETPKSFETMAVAFEEKIEVVTSDDSWMIEAYTYPEERCRNWELPKFIQDSRRTRENKKERRTRRRKN